MTVFEQGKNAKGTLTFMSQVTTEQKNNDNMSFPPAQAHSATMA